MAQSATVQAEVHGEQFQRPVFGHKGVFSVRRCLPSTAVAVQACYRLIHSLPMPKLLHKAPRADLKAVKRACQTALGEGTEILEVPPGQNLEDTVLQIHALNPEQRPFYVVDLAVPVRMYETWCRLLPRVKPHYAVKCNPDKGIVAALAACGCCFDCASPFEFERVLGVGVPPEKIIYANATKTPAYIRRAAELGVRRMTFDNDFEVDKMLENHPNAELVLRVAVAGGHSLINFTSKFGASPEEAKWLVRLCKEKGANLVGCSFHVGSGCLEVSAYDRALTIVREVFDFAKTVGYTLTLVDLGGGWPGGDVGDNLPESDNPEEELHPESHKSGIVEVPPFSAFAEHVNGLLDKLFPSDPSPGGVVYEFISEPGRFFATEAITEACSVIAKRAVYPEPLPEGVGPNKTIIPKESILGWKFYLSDGVFGSMNNALTDHVRPISRILYSSNPDLADTSKWLPCTFFGPTCSSTDTINKGVWMPELHVGDWIYHRMFGAYTTTLTTRYNGFPDPLFYYVITMPVEKHE